MAFYNELYFTTDVVLTLFALIILYFTNRGGSIGKGWGDFNLCIILSVSYFLSDGIVMLLNGNVNFPIRIASYILIAGLYSVGTLLGSSWFGYAWFHLEHVKSKVSGVLRVLGLVSFLLVLLLCVLSYWQPFLFSVDEKGSYIRGDFFYLPFILAFFWSFSASFLAFVSARKEENKFKRKQNYLLASFPILPIIGACLQTFIPEIPFIAFGLSLAFLSFFITAQTYHFSLDELTGLYNRSLLARNLRNYARHSSPLAPSYLIIADVDSLKKINDTYGHLMGDQAIVTVASVLKNAISPRDFCCRYGGDEFMVVVHPSSTEEIQRLQGEINRMIAQDNERRGENSYHLSLSYGIAPLEGKCLSEEEYIKQADVLLYQSKSRREN